MYGMMDDKLVHSDAHGAQIRDPQNTAHNIATKIIEHQNFPDRVAIGIEDRSDRREQGVGLGIIFVVGFNRLVQIENLPERH